MKSLIKALNRHGTNTGLNLVILKQVMEAKELRLNYYAVRPSFLINEI